MKYILDLVLLVIFAGCIYSGSRKGAVRMLISLAGYIAAFAAAVFVSSAASEYVYDEMVKPTVMSALETKANELADEYLSPQKLGEILTENGVKLTEEQLVSIIENGEEYSELLTDEKFQKTLNNMFTEYCTALTEAFSGVVPDEIIEEAEKYIENTNVKTESKLELLTVEKQSVIELVEAEIVRPVMMSTIKAILFALTFSAVMIIVKIICHAVKFIREIPVLRTADGFLGSMLGIIQSLLFSVIISVGVSVFIKLTSGANEYLNAGTISETIVFKFFYSGTFFLLSLILK